jgi:hypothetical protein
MTVAKVPRLSFASRRLRQEEKVLWSDFINRRPSDERATLVGLIRSAPIGPVHPVKGALHSPTIMREQFNALGGRLGALGVGVVRFDDEVRALFSGIPDAPEASLLGRPYVLVAIVPANDDPNIAQGLGGQTPVLKGLMVSYLLASYCRELGYSADFCHSSVDPQLAALAGLGSLNPGGKFHHEQVGARVWVADAIYTDLPLGLD